MKTLIATLFTAAILMSASPAQAGCDHSWQTASDGSNCGDRAADQRPGGK